MYLTYETNLPEEFSVGMWIKFLPQTINSTWHCVYRLTHNLNYTDISNPGD